MIETFLSLAGGSGAAMPIQKGASNVPGGHLVDIPKPKPFLEYGVTGLLRSKGTGYVYEEWLAALATGRAKLIFREMRDNDAVIGGMFFALETILRRAVWTVKPGAGKLGNQYGEFVEQCIGDMSHTWEDFIAETVNMFAFGFSLAETVYKRRLGRRAKNPSKYDDGLIGWRKMAPRAQESILYWDWDDEGGLQGCVQVAPPDYNTQPIPIAKLLLFRTTSLKGNPEGRSLLRNCYRSWMFKRRIEEVEAIGIERDLCGLPVLYLSQEAQESIGGESVAKALVTGIRRDEDMGVVLPMALDAQGNQMVRLELLRAAGQRQADPAATIARYNHDILNTMLAGFIEFGQQPNGNRALHTSAKGIFYAAISAFMDSIAGVMNRYALPRLLAMNKMDLDSCPELVPGEVGDRDLDELAGAVLKLAQSGLTFFDIKTENFLRKKLGLPELEEDENAGPAQRPPQQPGGAAPPPRGAPGQRRSGPAEQQDGQERLETAA